MDKNYTYSTFVQFSKDGNVQTTKGSKGVECEKSQVVALGF